MACRRLCVGMLTQSGEHATRRIPTQSRVHATRPLTTTGVRLQVKVTDARTVSVFELEAYE